MRVSGAGNMLRAVAPRCFPIPADGVANAENCRESRLNALRDLTHRPVPLCRAPAQSQYNAVMTPI